MLYETKVPFFLPTEGAQKIYEPVLQYISDKTPERLYRYRRCNERSFDTFDKNERFANDKDLEYMKALHQTTLVLTKFGHLGPYTGYCLTIDEDGDVLMKPPQLLH